MASLVEPGPSAEANGVAEEAAAYVDSIMSTQQVTRVGTPCNTGRKRNRSAPSPSLDSMIKKARNTLDSPPILDETSPDTERSKKTETRRALYTASSTPTPAPRRKVPPKSRNSGSEMSMEMLINKLSADINDRFTDLNARIDRLENGIEQKRANKVAQIIDKRLNAEFKRIRKDVDTHIEKVSDGIRAEVAADLADMNKKLNEVSAKPSYDISCNVVVRNLPESERENIEEKVSQLISEGCGVRDVTVVAAERKRGPRGKPGPIVAKLRSVEEKNAVLNNKRKLKNSRRFSNVYVHQDQTKSDRIMADNFRAIMAAVKSGNHDLSMRGSRVVKSDTSDNRNSRNSQGTHNARSQGGHDGNQRRFPTQTQDTTPSFTNLPASTTIANNEASGVSLFTVAVDDVDNDDDSTLAVTMTTNTQFTFDTSTLEISTNTITSTGGTERLVFRVVDQCDNTGTATYTVIITNPPPTIHSLPGLNSISEDATVETLLHTINVTDPGDTVTCSMSGSVPASYPFLVKQIPSSTDYGIYSESNPGFSYNTLHSYSLSVDCTDTVNTVIGDFTVSLIQNSAPVIQNLQNSTSVSTTATIGSNAFTVITLDAEGDTLSYSMTCNPTPCPFQIYASGQIQVTQDITTHTTVGYDLYITVADARNSHGPKTLTITITDINDPVLISNLPLASSLSITENTALATSVFTVSYSDLDTTQTHTYSMNSSPTNGILYFNIDSSTGLVSTAGNVLDYEALGGTTTFTFVVTVTDTVASDARNLVIDVINENEAPVFNPKSYSLSANEGPTGASVGTPLFMTTDPDNADTISYTMDCASYSNYFYMMSSSGNVTYQSEYDLDTGSLPSTVPCNVTATDSGGLTDTATLVINIADVNDNTPTFVPTHYTFYVGYYDNVGTTVGTVTATDADMGAFGTMTLTLDQTSLGQQHFAIDTSGVIILQSEPEGSIALNYTNAAIIKALATDSGGRVGTATVTVIVSDTTTTTATTTTYVYKTFFDDPHNWAWFVPCILALIAAVIITCWMACTCHGKQGCKALSRNVFNRQTKMRSYAHKQNRGRFSYDFRPDADDHVTVRRAPPKTELQSWRTTGY